MEVDCIDSFDYDNSYCTKFDSEAIKEHLFDTIKSISK